MTQLQIINLSLNVLGQNTITQAQLDANAHPSAVAANLWWAPCRDEVQGANNWSFATVTESLTAYNKDDSQWDFVYAYPTMAVSTMWRVFNEGTASTADSQKFTVKNIPTLGVSAIFTDLQYAIAEYTYKITDTSLWTNNFNMAFVYRLAAAMAITITGSGDKGIAASQAYNNLLSEAKRLSFSEKNSKPDDSNSYIAAR